MRRGAALAVVLAVATGVGAAEGEGLREDLGPEPTGDADVAAFAAISAAFTRRLQDRFPPGTPVSALRKELAEEGFVEEGRGTARLEEDGFLCRLLWMVTWEADMGVLVSVEGAHDGVCL